VSNANVHIAAGAIAGIGSYILGEAESDQHSSGEMISAGVIGALFGEVPDLIEPATNPHHRQFFHSAFVFGGLLYGAKSLYEWKPSNESQRILRALGLAALAGYASHLLLDSRTPMSLPILGKL
tara:strand:+ start:2677 stop:3048 length:372 start_codon:yes stop_codon:yes gene_type:complete